MTNTALSVAQLGRTERVVWWNVVTETTNGGKDRPSYRMLVQLAVTVIVHVWALLGGVTRVGVTRGGN